MFILSSQNVADYLRNREIDRTINNEKRNITLKYGKNFNLLVENTTKDCILVKQERLEKEQSVSREFINEWHIQEWLDRDPKLQDLRHLMPEVVDFDRDNAIVVIKYYRESQDLDCFYREREDYPQNIATALGKSIAAIHSTTFNSEDDRRFLQTNPKPASKILREIGKLHPNIFGIFCSDGMEFFRLYQSRGSIKESILQLQELWHPCCLVHGDLKLDNILVNLPSNNIDVGRNLIRFIDWEKYFWGDPAYDLATIIECYLRIWLKSLLISPEIDFKLSLQLASTPLESLQPSLNALITSYLQHFPQIIAESPNFCRRLMQLTGYIAISKMIHHLESHSPFDNRAICTLQVAKILLCRPQEAFSFVFGRSDSDIGRN
jgi:serine/threonine protein kinase